MVARGTQDQDWRDFPLKMMEGTTSYKLHGKGTQQGELLLGLVFGKGRGQEHRPGKEIALPENICLFPALIKH